MSDEPMIVIDGQSYYEATYNVCPVCHSDDVIRYLMVKMRLAGGDVVLECPNCDFNITVSPAMVIKNANYSRKIGQVDEPTFE